MGWNLERKKRKRLSTHNSENVPTNSKNVIISRNSKVDSTDRSNPDSDNANLRTSKKTRSLKDLVEAMKPSVEELKFRKEKSKEIDFSQNPLISFGCTKCQKSFILNSDKEDKVKVHPCLGVLMCESCCDYYGDGEFSLDSEGEDKYCRWCGEGGTILSCSKCICGFCASCIKKHFGIEYFKKVEQDDDWLCFFCNPKPLWPDRYICSLAVQLSENKVSSMAERGKKGTGNQKKNSKTPDIISKSPKFSKNCILQLSDSSSTDLDKWPSRSLCGRKSNKSRKRFYSSSSDESDMKSADNNSKKIRLSSKELEGSSEKKENFDNLKQMVLEKLERVLKLSEYQLAFGVNWSSKTLKKLADPKLLITREALQDECEKIKWFLSVLSTYLLEFCNSVDSVEKLLMEKDELKDCSCPSQQGTDSTGFSTILKFLSFITGQVNTFVKKGISLSDVLEAEIHDDDKFIGFKKKLKPSNSSCTTEIVNNTLRQVTKSKFEKNKKDGQLNMGEEKSETDDDDSQDEDSLRIVVNQNSEALEGGNEFTDMNSSSGTLGDTANTRISDPRQDILQILEILEHA